MAEVSVTKTWVAYLLAFIAGACLPLAFAPLNFYPFAVVCPALLFYLCLDCSSKRAACLGYVFGLGLFGVGISWVFVAFHVFGHTGLVVALLLTATFVAFVALCIALQTYISARLIKKINNSYRLVSPLILIIILPAVWTLTELFRGWFLTGFPWLNLGYSQIDTPIAGLAPIFGVYGMSWVLACCAGFLLLILQGTHQQRIYSSISLLIIWGGAYFLGQIAWTQKIDDPLKVSLVQGNVPQLDRWDSEKIQAGLDVYADLSREHWDSDLIVWPENAITVLHTYIEDSFLKPLAAEALGNDTDFIIGLPYDETETSKYYSSMMSLGKTPGVFHKRHLVPFGEFVPLESLLRGLVGFFDLPMSGFSRGKNDQTLLVAAGQPIAVSICYEDAFGEELIKQLPEATLLFNGSNNAWYGDSLAPHQHLQISRMRARETGRDLLRATTNGISAIINHQGELRAISPQFETYVLSGVVQPRSGATPYVRWGNWPIVLVLFGLLICSWVFRRK